MDTRKVRALIAVVESGNMTAAAEELGYTPSGMSRMMDTLEKELGIPLLIRSNGGVSPTRGCLQMLPAMKDLVRLADDIQSRAKEAVDGITGEIRISSAYSTYYRPLWKGDVTVLPVRPEIRVPIGIAASEKRFISPAASLFLEYMKDHLPLLNETGSGTAD